MNENKKWLNGWPGNSSTLVMGTGVFCIGCGKYHGLACVAMDKNHKYPEKLPDYPFPENNCPVCINRKMDINSFSIEELATLGESKLRKVMIYIKLT